MPIESFMYFFNYYNSFYYFSIKMNSFKCFKVLFLASDWLKVF